MTIKRFLYTCGLAVQKGGSKRAAFCRKRGLFHHVGKNVTLQSRVLPLYSELISFGNNVHVASHVNFITHDIVHVMLNANPEIKHHGFKEKLGCIEICDNVFIGAGVTVLYNVRIGPNTVIAAESVVTKDLEGNGVYAGCPARKIEDIPFFLQKRAQCPYEGIRTPNGLDLSKELTEALWEEFCEKRKKQ